MLTDEDRMALVFAPDNADTARAALGGDPDDPTTWKGIQANYSKTIEEIRWADGCIYLEGSFNCTVLPSRLIFLHLSAHGLWGEIHLTSLPETMMLLEIEWCCMTGMLDLNNLPPYIESVKIQQNAVTAVEDIGPLHAFLRVLVIDEKFAVQKPVCIAPLPSGINVKLHGVSPRSMHFERKSDLEHVECDSAI